MLWRKALTRQDRLNVGECGELLFGVDHTLVADVGFTKVVRCFLEVGRCLRLSAVCAFPCRCAESLGGGRLPWTFTGPGPARTFYSPPVRSCWSLAGHCSCESCAASVACVT
jgi:hypothetical protein